MLYLVNYIGNCGLMIKLLSEYNFLQILGRHLFKHNICVPNVLLTIPGKGQYEADLIYFNLKTLSMTEVEIKISLQDFMNDFKKKIYHEHNNVMYLYYCLPSNLYYANKEVIDSKLGNAGLILINDKYQFDGYQKRAKKRKMAAKLSLDQAINFMRIGCMKWIKDKSFTNQ